MSADFTPEKEDYKILTPFKMQVLTNFPYIEADFDALTNYQLLCKVVEYLNNVIHNENEVTEQVNSLYNAYVSLQNYVNTYFSNLDVQEEINNKIDEMIRSGEFDLILNGIIQPYFSTISETIANMQDEIDDVDYKVTLAVGKTPIPVDSTSDMTDTNQVYVNTTNGKWYYYDTTNSEWAIGGTYQAAEDSTKVINMWNTFDKTYDYNLFDYENRIQHAILNTHGVISYQEPDSQYYQMCVSPKLDVSGADYIVFNYMKPTTFCLYDESDNLIHRYASTDASLNVAHPTYVDGEQAKYMMASYNPVSTYYDFNKTQYYLTDDSTDTLRDYVPYNNIIMKREHLPVNIDPDAFKFEPNFYPAGIKEAAWRGFRYAYNPLVGYNQPYAPENSFPAFRKAGEEKADFLWLAAVRYTTDDEFYIMHDATTGRTCTTDITVASSTSEQMDALTLRQVGWITWTGDDLKVPKLEDAIKLAYSYNINIGIRLGSMPSNNLAQNKDIWDKFIALCERYHLDNAIYSGTVSQCNVVNSYHSNWMVQVTGSSSATEQDNLDLLDTIISLGYNRKAVIFYKNNLTENVMEKAHANNIYVFGVADEPIIDSDTLAQYKNLCVDAIITAIKIDLT